MKKLYLDIEAFRKNRFKPEVYFDVLEITSGVVNYGSNPIFVKELLSLPKVGTRESSMDLRPDYEAFLIWSKSELWWALLLYNKMYVTDLIRGTPYNYFSLFDFESLIYDLFLKERDYRRRIL